MRIANLAPGSASTLSVSGNYGLSNYTDNGNWAMSAGTTMIQSALKVNGNAEFDGDITIKGSSLIQTIDKINQRLNILVPNEQLEQAWQDLADLRMRYVELERQLLEKQRTFDILKKSD